MIGSRHNMVIGLVRFYGAVPGVRLAFVRNGLEGFHHQTVSNGIGIAPSSSFGNVHADRGEFREIP